MGKGSDLPSDLDFVPTEELADELINRTDKGLLILVPRGEEVETSWSVGDAMELVRQWVKEQIEEESEGSED